MIEEERESGGLLSLISLYDDKDNEQNRGRLCV